MLRASASDVARRRRLAVWWITSLSLLAAVLLGFTSYFIVSTIRSWIPAQHLGCLPPDFPLYRSLTVLEIDQSFALPANAGIAQCRMRLSSNDDYSSVNAFYRAHLNMGDWAYTFYSDDVSGSIIDFDRRSHRTTHGSMRIHNERPNASLEVQLTG